MSPGCDVTFTVVIRVVVEDGTYRAAAHSDDVNAVFTLLSLSDDERDDMRVLIRQNGRVALEHVRNTHTGENLTKYRDLPRYAVLLNKCYVFEMIRL